MTKQYDEAYFQHWYRRSDIGGPQRLARKVALAVACAEYYLERPIRTVLDIGCGEGAWRAPLLKLRPKLHGRYARFGRRKPGNLKQEFATLLAVVAHAGNSNAMAAQHAYLSGLQRVLPRDHLPYAPPPQGVQALDDVWEGLDALDPLAKQVMVEAITAAVSHDGKVSVAESELLRTICGVLHCPLPAMLEQA